MRSQPRRIWVALLSAAAASLSCTDPPASVEHPRVSLVSPYATSGVWLKADFHVHSTHSHGAMDPGDLVRLYGQNGFAAICISDHNQYGDQDGGTLSAFYQRDLLLHDWNGDGITYADSVFGSGVEAGVRDWNQPPPMWHRDRWYRPANVSCDSIPFVLSGYEASYGYFGAHFVLVGYPPGPIAPPCPGFEWLAPLHRAGGFAIIAHPAESNLDSRRFATVIPVDQFDALEIQNGARLTRGEAADATPLWDALLRSGHALWGVANDDAHRPPGAADLYPFVAFDMVLCAEPSPAALLAALHSGSFYASTGLMFGELRAAGPSLYVRVPGARRLRFVTGDSTSVAEYSGSEATWTAQGHEIYVRAEAYGDSCRGARANWLQGVWSQPFRVTVAPAPTTRR